MSDVSERELIKMEEIKLIGMLRMHRTIRTFLAIGSHGNLTLSLGKRTINIVGESAKRAPTNAFGLNTGYASEWILMMAARSERTKGSHVTTPNNKDLKKYKIIFPTFKVESSEGNGSFTTGADNCVASSEMV